MKNFSILFRLAFIFFLVAGGVWAFGSLPADAATEIVQPVKNVVPEPATLTLLVSNPEDIFHLTIAKNILAGNADGLITSDPGGIDCGTTCEADFESAVPITLTVLPDPNSTFLGWGDGCTGLGNTCILNLEADTTISPTFAELYTVTVKKDGEATGTVTSSIPGIDCGDTCESIFPGGYDLTLTGSPDPGAYLEGWSSECTVTEAGACDLTLDSVKVVTATFNLLRNLLVTKDGNGGGTITSDPAALDCGANCSVDLPKDFTIYLIATPDGISDFAGWSENCTPVADGVCAATMDESKTVNATFILKKYALDITKSGSGSGSVSSSPVGIDCGSDCTEDYEHGTLVTLTAAPASDAIFSGWSPNCTVTGEFTCQVTVDQARTVDAAFTKRLTLTVTPAGDGSGTVTSSPIGINCGSDCSEVYNYDTVVTLTAVPAAGSTFAGWSSNCTVTLENACQVTMLEAKTVTATFTVNSYILAIVKQGTGGGVVTSSQVGINCGTDCSESYLYGTVITLTAAPDLASTFVSWSANCTVLGPLSCQVTLDAAKEVVATFNSFKLFMPMMSQKQ